MVLICRNDWRTFLDPLTSLVQPGSDLYQLPEAVTKPLHPPLEKR
jgi:hypothetical protein